MATANIAPMSETTMSNALVANNLPIPSAMGSLEAYIGAVHQIPVLSVEARVALTLRMVAGLSTEGKGGFGVPRTNRAGRAAKAASSTWERAACSAGACP